VIPSFPSRPCPGIDRETLDALCDPTCGDGWRNEVLRGVATARLRFPTGWEWFPDYARACQLRHVDAARSGVFLLLAASRAELPGDRPALKRAHAQMCLDERLAVPSDQRVIFVESVQEGLLDWVGTLDEIVICARRLRERGETVRLLEVAAVLCDLAFMPVAPRIPLGTPTPRLPELELVGEEESESDFLARTQGHGRFHGLTCVMSLAVDSADLIRFEPGRWAFLQPRTGRWLDDFAAYLRPRDVPLLFEDELRDLLALIDEATEIE
jgi:hypothetical protein